MITPGPWRIYRDSQPAVVSGSDDDDTFRYVAQDMTEADAALIAAAPDLLAANESLLAVLRDVFEHVNDEMDLDRDDKPNWAMRLGAQFSGRLNAATDAADAAVAKAVGK